MTPQQIDDAFEPLADRLVAGAHLLRRRHRLALAVKVRAAKLLSVVAAMGLGVLGAAVPWSLPALAGPHPVVLAFALMIAILFGMSGVILGYAFGKRLQLVAYRDAVASLVSSRALPNAAGTTSSAAAPVWVPPATKTAPTLAGAAPSSS